MTGLKILVKSCDYIMERRRIRIWRLRSRSLAILLRLSTYVFLSFFSLAYTHLQPSYFNKQEDIFVIGRVTQDYDTSSIAPSTKLTESTITLESSRLLSMGTRVPLVFQTPFHVRGGIRGAAGLGFFPGQIVALKGRNGGGGKFAAAEVVAVSAPPAVDVISLGRITQRVNPLPSPLPSYLLNSCLLWKLRLRLWENRRPQTRSARDWSLRLARPFRWPLRLARTAPILTWNTPRGKRCWQNLKDRSPPP